jgi:hypothetical protein
VQLSFCVRGKGGNGEKEEGVRGGWFAISSKFVVGLIGFLTCRLSQLLTMLCDFVMSCL